MSKRSKDLDPDLLDRLKSIVGEKGWISPEGAPKYLEDPRGRFKGQAALILMPTTTEQVAGIVSICNEGHIGIIPFGGGTGVVAGQLATDNAAVVILSLERMNKIREISPDDGVLVAEAGCILQDIHDAAGTHALTFPLSMASKGSCSIGGNLATNAGGIQVVRHGNARDLCLGIEAVLPSGAIYSDLKPLRKDNTGYDLRHLLIGSEGTLGVITAATLVLKPVDPETCTVLCALKSPADALRLYRHLNLRLGQNLSALELMSRLGMDLVLGHFTALPPPFAESRDWFLLIEASGPEGLQDVVETVLSETLESGLVVDAVMSQSQQQKANLWDLRENTPEVNRREGAFCSSDTSVPISKVDAFISATHGRIHALHPDVRINTYGHIGDGNIHHNVLPPDGVTKAAFLKMNPELVDATRMAINETSVQFGGSISAEHGIGRLKSGDLLSYAPPAKLDALKAIKLALDPNGVLNPGAIFGP